MTPRDLTAEDFDGVLDAYAWIKASLLGDNEARVALARSVDPVKLVDALTGMIAVHLIEDFGNPIVALDHMSAEAVRAREASQ